MSAIAAVPRAEHDLLVIARALVEPGSFDSVETLLRGRDAAAPKAGKGTIGPTAMRLLREALAKGSVLALARGGGFRARGRIAPGGNAVNGRLWQVHPSLALQYSPYSFELVRWMASASLASPKVARLDAVPTTAGDELVAYFACALVEGTEIAGVVAAQPAVQSSALAWLAFPRALALAAPSGAPPGASSLAKLVTGPGAVVIEGLEDELARRWVAAVHAGAKLSDARASARAGGAETAVLAAFLEAADAAGRRDLASFLVTAASRLFAGGASGRALAAAWAGAFDPKARLGDKADARRVAAAPVRALATLGRWYQEMSVMRFFDDGYEAAQLLLARWEMIGAEGFARAEDVARELEALDAGTAVSPAGEEESAR